MIGYKESLLKPLGYNNTLGCTLDERGTTLHEVLHTKQTFLLPTVETQNNYSNNKANGTLYLMSLGCQLLLSGKNSVNVIPFILTIYSLWKTLN